MGGDVSLEDFQGKRVVVVGMGAFGVENVRRALRGGASSVTLLSRRFDKLLFPERVSYLLRSRLQASDAFEDENLVRSLKRYIPLQKIHPSSVLDRQPWLPWRTSVVIVCVCLG